MDIDLDLVWQVLHWAMTLAIMVFLFFSAISLLSKDDPGGLFVSNPSNLLSWEAAFVIALFASLVWFCSYGAFSLFWYVPEFVDTDEGVSRSGAALAMGLVVAGAIHQLAIKINQLYWRQVGQDETLADVKRNFSRMVEKGPEARQHIEAIIKEIEGAKRPYETHSDRVARERRVAFFNELKNLA